ncbi:hypothetical protein [Chryseobacterium sp. c4a]|uniref:hypothetical protein n=1 Tax=Chryseobacterium sp. c4a TaxID=1573582 RepID=UPI0013588602|nr:hypothetical protein [Chryseobacterium sp. c4a]
MSKKKLLIHEVFNKAREDFPKKTAKSGLALELSNHFEEKWNFIINERTFVRYYNICIINNKEPDIRDGEILDQLSRYLEYENFDDFCKTFVKKNEDASKTTVKIKVDEDDESFPEKLARIINITISNTNTPYFNMPEFVKQNGLGIAGAFLIISVLIGNYYSSKGKISMPITLFDNRNCMFWEDNEYKLANCEDKNPRRSLIPKDTIQLKYFKRITRKDTLTVNNALGKTWYSKYNGHVEFFTMDGVDPDTGRELRASTEYIIDKYAGY